MTRTIPRERHALGDEIKRVDSTVTKNLQEAEFVGDPRPLLFCLLDCLQDADSSDGAEPQVVDAIFAAIGGMCRNGEVLNVLDGCFSYIDRSQCRITGPPHKSRVLETVSRVVLPRVEREDDEIPKGRIVELVGIVVNEISNNSESSLLSACASVLSQLARINLDCVLVEIFSRADTVGSSKANVYIDALVEICGNCAESDGFKHLHATEIIRITDDLDSSTRHVSTLIAGVCKRVVDASDTEFPKKVNGCQWLHEDPVAFKVVKAAFDRLMGRITQDVESGVLSNALKIDIPECSARLEAAGRLLLFLLDRSPTAVVGSIAVIQKACLIWLGSLLKIRPPKGTLSSCQIAPVLSGVRILAASGKAFADRESLLELQDLLVSLVQSNRPLAVLPGAFTPAGIDSIAVVDEVLETWVSLGGEQCMSYLLDKKGLAEPSQPHTPSDRCVALLCMRACAVAGLATSLLGPTLDMLCRETRPPASSECTTVPVEVLCLVEVLSVMGARMAPLPVLYDYLLSLVCLTDSDCEREVALTAGQRLMKRFSTSGGSTTTDWPRRERDGMTVVWRTVRKRALDVLLEQARRQDQDQQSLHASAVLYDRLMALLLSGTCDREHQLDKACLVMSKLISSNNWRELVTPLGVAKGCHLLIWLLSALADEGLNELGETPRRPLPDLSARRNIVNALRSLAASIHGDLKTMWESPFSRLSELESGSRSSGEELELFFSQLSVGSDADDEPIYAEAVCDYITKSLLPRLASLATVPAPLEQEPLTPRSTLDEGDQTTTSAAGASLAECDGELEFPSTEVRAADRASALDATTGTAFLLLGVAASHIPSIVKMAEYVDKWILLTSKFPSSSQNGGTSSSAVLLARPQGRRGLAKALGKLAGVHFDHITDLIRRAASSQVATRRPSAFAIFDNTELLQQGEWVRATVNASLGYCAAFAPSPRALQRRLRAFFLEPLLTALKEERKATPLAAAIRGIKLTADGLMRADAEGNGNHELELDPSLALLRDELVVALLPFLLQPVISNSAVSSAAWKLDGGRSLSSSASILRTEHNSMGMLLCDVLQCVASLIALPLDLQPRIFAQARSTEAQR
ncbi:hypothetical protein FOL47_011098 [Perkinsus chesapeaki]|uniref:Uncharacterized protein n=1 Tax=Perkinsus chesapeaki TaxID=330153 RepID=A0A7J6L0T2_PERCH|nr:hypothetical protein FOL47_011098 [Perkinsus chesapeaki]